MTTPSADRGQWSSQLGFVLAAAGSAVGLGNVWRFPYTAGESGGGAFVLVYLLCVLLLGLPVMLLEISLGRATQKNPVGAIRSLRPRGPWQLLGFLAVACGVGILSFYSVIAGEVLAVCLDYSQQLVTGTPLVTTFGPAASLVFFALFLVITVLVVVGGVQRGIERWAKILMPLLLLVMLGIIARVLLLPGAGEGVRWLLQPDFGKISFTVVLDAMAQAFFSLSLGMGAMLTYGSYLPKDKDILRCGGWVVACDTTVAVLAGLMIFPAVFALGHQPGAGPTLIFQVLPTVFAEMAGGTLVGAVFFFLLVVAALTSTVSLLEVVVAYFVDELGWSRARTVWTAGAVTFVIGIPAALAWVGVEPLASLHLLGQDGVFSLMDFLFVSLALPLGAILLCLFASTVWGLGAAGDEIASSSPCFARVAPLWRLLIRWVCPVVVVLILFTRFIPVETLVAFLRGLF